MNGGNAFIELRDRLLREGISHAQALQSFHWPAISHFNWASDYFDRIAMGNDRPALRVVDSTVMFRCSLKLIVSDKPVDEAFDPIRPGTSGFRTRGSSGKSRMPISAVPQT